MPSSVSPEELKAYLRLNDGGEDSLLATFIDSAEATFKNLTGRTLDDNATTGFPAGIPANVRLAVMLLASFLYANREAYADQRLEAMPFGFVNVCRQYSDRFVSGGM